jgi:CheY-like chemotaxis protein
MTHTCVLIVDDHVDSAESLAELLKFSGYATRIAHDGEQGLELAAAWQPQVALLDLSLPGVGGLEVARRLRASAWGREALLIALSGWAGDDARRHAIEAGFDHYLVKPAELETLLGLMSKVSAPAADARAA